jgi:hypothetical protein
LSLSVWSLINTFDQMTLELFIYQIDDFLF